MTVERPGELAVEGLGGVEDPQSRQEFKLGVDGWAGAAQRSCANPMGDSPALPGRGKSVTDPGVCVTSRIGTLGKAARGGSSESAARRAAGLGTQHPESLRLCGRSVTS